MSKEQTMKEALTRFVELTRVYINTDSDEYLEDQLLNHCLKCDELITTQYIFHRPPEGYTNEDIVDCNIEGRMMKIEFQNGTKGDNSINIPYQLISRKEAHELLGCDDYGLQNYELEMELDRYVGLDLLLTKNAVKSQADIINYRN